MGAATWGGRRAALPALHALVPGMLHGGMEMRRPLVAALALELPVTRAAKVMMVVLLRTTRASKARSALRAAKVLRSRPLLGTKAVPETLSTAKAASGAESAAALAEAGVLTEAVAKAVPKVLLRTAGASGRTALGATEVLSATRRAELAAMTKGLRAATTEAPAKAAVLMPARPLRVLETVVLLMMLSTGLRRRISRAGTSLRVRMLHGMLPVPATLLAVHGRAAEVSTPLIVILATVTTALVATRRIVGAAPTLILGRVQGGAGTGALRPLRGAARDLRTRGGIARAFRAWRVAPLRCGGRGRALRSGLGRRRGLIDRLCILG